MGSRAYPRHHLQRVVDKNGALLVSVTIHELDEPKIRCVYTVQCEQ